MHNLDEQAAGIKHYSTSTEGIGGSIKRRIADFIVEEIMPDGKVCWVKAFTDKEKIAVEKKWPELLKSNREEENQLILTMEKYNTDTNNAIRRVARFLQTSKRRIGYAGMKDKRAITCQRISIWNADLEKVKGIDSRYIDLRDAEWKKERVEIGDLKGNMFRVIIRNLELERKEIERRVKACFKEMERGIANYFGEQRFGGIRGITHLVGREFVKGSIEKGVMMYLTASDEREEEDVRNAREHLAETNDFSQATNEFPPKYRYERAILHHLCKYPKDFVGAFSRLPKGLTYMFTHAYQSYLFNNVINKRIEEGTGLEAVEGDILEDGFATAPLYGFESKLADGKVGEIERKVLEEDEVRLEDFHIKAFPQISSKGARKKILLFPGKLKLISIDEDEFNEGKLRAAVSFELTKGNYATTVLRELMKNG